MPVPLFEQAARVPKSVASNPPGKYEHILAPSGLDIGTKSVLVPLVLAVVLSRGTWWHGGRVVAAGLCQVRD